MTENLLIPGRPATGTGSPALRVEDQIGRAHV